MGKGLKLALGGFQLCSPFLDTLLKSIVSFSQSSLTLLYLRQHLIEGVDQDGQFAPAASWSCTY